MQIDLYFYGTDHAVIDLLEQVRAWHCRRVRIWLDEQTQRAWRKGCFRDAQTIDQNVAMPGTFFYHEWQLDPYSILPVSDSGRIALIKRIRDEQDVNFVVVSSASRCKEKMVAFADEKDDPKLPDVFTQVPWFDNINDLRSYCLANGVLDFDLKNPAVFRDAGKTYNGAKIYREISTGHLVYEDTLHHNHYEVFDRTGVHHLGEMNDQGVLDGTKADPRKHITL